MVVESYEAKKSLEQITKSMRSLLTVKVTLPLNNPNLKLLHTNMFIYLPLPSDFLIENFEVIAKALNSSDSRYSGYVKDRWYVEGIHTKDDGKTQKMELTLNPFATSHTSYKEDYLNLVKAYSDAVNNQNKSTSTSKSTQKTKLISKSNKTTIQQAINEVGKLMEKKKYKRYTFSDYTNFVKHGYGDCWAGAYFMACQLQKRGVEARIIQYATSASSRPVRHSAAT